MHPVLLTTPFFTLYTFGVLLAAAYLTALAWMVRGARRAGLNPDAMMSLGTWAIVGAIVGAKALLAIRSPQEYLTSLSALRALVSSAGDFYGGFIGALIASAIFFRRHPQLPFWRAADVCAPAIALGQAIGRIGCFMAGDDYGRPASVPWAVTFTDPDAARLGGVPLGVPLHPVQLYESAVCLALFGVLVWLARRRHRDGDIIVAYTLLYAIARFVLEFFRGDEDRGFIFGGLLSTSQFIAIILFGVAVVVLIVRRRMAKPVASALLIATAVAIAACSACTQRVPQPANAVPGMPQVSWVLMSGDKDNPDSEFVCQSDPPGECVMPATRPGEEVYSDAHFYYHGTGADTAYTGSILIGPLESSGAPYRMQASTTVKKDERIINQSVAARVTSRPGTYDVVVDIMAKRSDSNLPQVIQFRFPVRVR